MLELATTAATPDTIIASPHRAGARAASESEAEAHP